MCGKDNTVLNPVIFQKECGQIHVNFVTFLWSPQNSTDTKKRLCWSKSTLQEACPYLLYREHALTYFTGSMTLLTPNNSSKTCGGLKVFISTKIYKKSGVKNKQTYERLSKAHKGIHISSSINQCYKNHGN